MDKGRLRAYATAGLAAALLSAAPLAASTARLHDPLALGEAATDCRWEPNAFDPQAPWVCVPVGAVQ
ncbi:hypothetical protein ACFWAR_19895 [Streptomyces sp. NPDC059917]|uniref:hypothetical protein n=1 Tax=Streptomyces sp. NPDC059917 TaxID=3347002 RepID=UPI00364BDCE5